jgi:tRNA nucleotidyltransferase (CCA-adding enzyme)
VLIFAALLHDVGKAVTTEEIDGHITSRGHAAEGAILAVAFLISIGAPEWLVDKVFRLVRYHMVPRTLQKRSGVLRLARDIAPATLGEIFNLSGADDGQDDKSQDHLLHLWLLAKDAKVINSAPKPLLMGRHLIPLGVAPGPEMGKLLATVYEAQLDDKVHNLEEAILYAQMLLS